MQFYTVNLKNHLNAARTFLLYIIVAIIATIIILFENVSEKEFAVKIILIVTLIINGPAIYIHFSYYLENENWVLNISEEFIEIKKSNFKNIIIDKNNIIRIDIYMSPSYIKYDIIGGLPTEDYNYMEITTDKENVVITNLLYPNIKQLAQKISPIKPHFHKTLFAIPKNEN
jgi:hypothetical protein